MRPEDQFHDYTLASKLERFVAAIEQTITSWQRTGLSEIIHRGYRARIREQPSQVKVMASLQHRLTWRHEPYQLHLHLPTALALGGALGRVPGRALQPPAPGAPAAQEPQPGSKRGPTEAPPATPSQQPTSGTASRTASSRKRLGARRSSGGGGGGGGNGTGGRGAAGGEGGGDWREGDRRGGGGCPPVLCIEGSHAGTAAVADRGVAAAAAARASRVDQGEGKGGSEDGGDWEVGVDLDLTDLLSRIDCLVNEGEEGEEEAAGSGVAGGGGGGGGGDGDRAKEEEVEVDGQQEGVSGGGRPHEEEPRNILPPTHPRHRHRNDNPQQHQQHQHQQQGRPQGGRHEAPLMLPLPPVATRPGVVMAPTCSPPEPPAPHQGAVSPVRGSEEEEEGSGGRGAEGGAGGGGGGSDRGSATLPTPAPVPASAAARSTAPPSDSHLASVRPSGRRRPGSLPWWLPARQHRLQRWFALDGFMVMHPASYSRRILDEAEAGTLLSAAALALHSCRLGCPLLLPVHDGLRDGYWGVAVGAAGSLHLRTDSVHISRPPESLTQLTTQLTALAEQLMPYSPAAAMACLAAAEADTDTDLDSTAGLPAPSPAPSPALIWTAVFTYRMPPAPGPGGLRTALERWAAAAAETAPLSTPVAAPVARQGTTRGSMGEDTAVPASGRGGEREAAVAAATAAPARGGGRAASRSSSGVDDGGWGFISGGDEEGGGYGGWHGGAGGGFGGYDGFEPWDAASSWQPWAVQVDPVEAMDLELVWEELGVGGGGGHPRLEASSASHWLLHVLSPAGNGSRGGGGGGAMDLLGGGLGGLRPRDSNRRHVELQRAGADWLWSAMAVEAWKRPGGPPPPFVTPVSAASQVGPGSFTVMLSSLLTARTLASGAAGLGQLTEPAWWDERGWRLPPLPPQHVMRDVLEDLFSWSAAANPTTPPPPPPPAGASSSIPPPPPAPAAAPTNRRTAPRGGLLSRLALHALLFGNARAVAWLWQRFVRELRFACWEVERPLPRMTPPRSTTPQQPPTHTRTHSPAAAAGPVPPTPPPPAGAAFHVTSTRKSSSGGVGRRSGGGGGGGRRSGGGNDGGLSEVERVLLGADASHPEPPGPDLGHCLLQQKLQVLDVCIHRRQSLARQRQLVEHMQRKQGGQQGQGQGQSSVTDRSDGGWGDWGSGSDGEGGDGWWSELASGWQGLTSPPRSKSSSPPPPPPTTTQAPQPPPPPPPTTTIQRTTQQLQPHPHRRTTSGSTREGTAAAAEGPGAGTANLAPHNRPRKSRVSTRQHQQHQSGRRAGRGRGTGREAGGSRGGRVGSLEGGPEEGGLSGGGVGQQRGSRVAPSRTPQLAPSPAAAEAGVLGGVGSGMEEGGLSCSPAIPFAVADAACEGLDHYYSAGEGEGEEKQQEEEEEGVQEQRQQKEQGKQQAGQQAGIKEGRGAEVEGKEKEEAVDEARATVTPTGPPPAPHPPVRPPALLQPPPCLSEDRMLERQEALMELAGQPQGALLARRLHSEQLSSDMAAFKAANPGGCSFTDFLRWYSPRDVVAGGQQGDGEGGASFALSARMAPHAGGGGGGSSGAAPTNPWHQLWEAVKPQHVWQQKPLQDPSLEAERLLEELDSLPPAHLYDTLLGVALGSAVQLLAGSEGGGLPAVAALVQQYIRISGPIIQRGLSLAAAHWPSSPPAPSSSSHPLPHSHHPHQQLVGWEDAELEYLLAEFHYLEQAVVLAESLIRRLPGNRQLAADLMAATLQGASGLEEGRTVMRPTAWVTGPTARTALAALMATTCPSAAPTRATPAAAGSSQPPQPPPQGVRGPGQPRKVDSETRQASGRPPPHPQPQDAAGSGAGAIEGWEGADWDDGWAGEWQQQQQPAAAEAAVHGATTRPSLPYDLGVGVGAGVGDDVVFDLSRWLPPLSREWVVQVTERRGGPLGAGAGTQHHHNHHNQNHPLGQQGAGISTSSPTPAAAVAAVVSHRSVLELVASDAAVPSASGGGGGGGGGVGDRGDDLVTPLRPQQPVDAGGSPSPSPSPSPSALGAASKGGLRWRQRSSGGGAGEGASSRRGSGGGPVEGGSARRGSGGGNGGGGNPQGPRKGGLLGARRLSNSGGAADEGSRGTGGGGGGEDVYLKGVGREARSGLGDGERGRVEGGLVAGAAGAAGGADGGKVGERDGGWDGVVSHRLYVCATAGEMRVATALWHCA